MGGVLSFEVTVTLDEDEWSSSVDVMNTIQSSPILTSSEGGPPILSCCCVYRRCTMLATPTTFMVLFSFLERGGSAQVQHSTWSIRANLVSGKDTYQRIPPNQGLALAPQVRGVLIQR